MQNNLQEKLTWYFENHQQAYYAGLQQPSTATSVSHSHDIDQYFRSPNQQNSTISINSVLETIQTMRAMKLNNPPKLNVPEKKPLPQMAQVPAQRSNSSYLPNNTRGIDDPFDDMDEALLNLDVESLFAHSHRPSLGNTIAVENVPLSSSTNSAVPRRTPVQVPIDSARTRPSIESQNSQPQQANQDLLALLKQRAELDAKIAALTNQSPRDISTPARICLDLTAEQKSNQNSNFFATEEKASNISMFSSHNTNYMSSWDDHPSEIRDRVIADYSAPVTDIDFSENYGQFADSSAPVCSCGIPCVKLMSRTSANLNREFFTCASKEANRCNFFQWVDGESSRYVQTTSGGFDPSLVKDFVVANKRIFGHNFFREGQKECIEAALQGRDVFCLMPTGGGKSLVYQLPAYCCPGVAVVFSPLLSLIQDQVDAMKATGIRAVYFSSTQDDYEGQQIYDELYRYSELSNSIKLLYLTPEKFVRSQKLKNLLKSLYTKNLISRFVLDEAHCLSEWGHDFRADYLSLRCIRSDFPLTPILALTATANQSVVNDCIKILGLRNPFRHAHSFNRPNIEYSVRLKDSKAINSIAEIIKGKRDQTGIVYCFSKKETEKVCSDLKACLPELSGKITFYHSDVPPEEKERRQRLWSKGDIKIICATIAFGMGINKPDVRYVIHYTMPKSLTNYYQESGRAGRDGFPSESIVYYCYSDKQRLASLAQKGNDENGSSNGPYAIERAIRNLNKCAAYCMNEIDCRRTQVLEYFGENFPSEKCKNTCDNCRRGSGAVVWLDVTEYAVMIVRIVSAIVEAKLPKVTINMLRTLLSNSKDKKLERYRALLERMRIPFDITDSRGKALSKLVCEKILHGMVVSDYLREDSEMTASSFTAEYVSVGSEANSLLNGSGKLSISVHSPKKKSITKSLPEDIEDEEVSLSGEQQYPPSIKSSSPDPKLASSTIKSHAGMLPSNKPWEANKSGKLALKKSDSRRSNQINLTESDDEFEESGRRKRMNISSANMISSDLSIESEMSPEILVRAQPSKRRAVNAVEEYILNVKQRNALRSWLNEYRKRWDSYWNYLNNSTVLELTRKVPLSTEALMNIGGIGEQKVKEHGKHIVATIWSFLQKNNLLHLFPELNLSEAHPPYDLPECPTWRDPMSAEAEAIRAANAAIVHNVSPMKTSHDNLLHNHSPSYASNIHHSPNVSMRSLSTQPLFSSPQSIETSSPGVYTYHSRPGVAPNLVQAVATSPNTTGNTSQQLHPYARYLNQRDGGTNVTPQKRPSPSDTITDDSSKRRVFDYSSHIVDPTNFLVSPDN